MSMKSTGINNLPSDYGLLRSYFQVKNKQLLKYLGSWKQKLDLYGEGL